MALWHGDELAAQPTLTATAALVRASASPPVGRENGWREQSRPAAGVLSRRLEEIFDHLECGGSQGGLGRLWQGAAQSPPADESRDSTRPQRTSGARAMSCGRS